jgi:hypothetical protein
VNRKRLVASIFAKAKKYRSFTRMIDDLETAQRILELTEELKVRALALAKPEEDHIRVRAREIWEENGRPSGRDQEFWYQAGSRNTRRRRYLINISYLFSKRTQAACGSARLRTGK